MVGLCVCLWLVFGLIDVDVPGVCVQGSVENMCESRLQTPAMSKVVYKVELYMSPEQWRNLSEWSLPHAAGDDARRPWLMLIHHGDKTDEYVELEKRLVGSVASEVVYTTN